MESPRQLDELQRWFLARITQPPGGAASDGDAEAGRGEPDLLPRIVEAGPQQSAGERLEVYQRAYFLRLLGVLREVFPATRGALGDDLFDGMAADYIVAHPPRSYTLARLADRFAEFLDATRPPDWGQFVVELVRFEQSLDRVFDGPGSENLPAFSLTFQAGADPRLALVPGLELHAFSHPVSTYYTAWKAGQTPEWPEPQDQFVAIYRRDYVVRRAELSRLQFVLLSAIARGRPLSAALDQALATVTDAPPAEELERQLFGWFQDWAASGLFASAQR